jgi:serine/threonine protein kinase/Tfp pilus assembly protein PilF
MIGQILSHYKILEKIGEGGMGEVYKAEDTKLKRTIALKFLPRTMTANAESRARFEQEAQVAAALNHPNIVTVYEIGEHDEQVFMAMEYVDGQTLKEKIAFHPLPLTEVLEITEKICEGLGAAHKAGIIHRDIKPQNILVDKNNHIKILDFGLAKLKGVSPLTKEASTLGTVNYMSPEQAKGKEVDQRTDIWSLGVVLYEMLTGELPFKGDYEQAVIYSILNEQPEKATEVRKDTPHELESILGKILDKEPEDRYQHVDDLLVDLKHLKRDSRSDRKPALAASWRKTRRWTKWGIPVAIILLAMVVSALFFILKEKSKSRPIAGTEPARAGVAPWSNSLAVLPFSDFSSKKDQEYFCDGMTEDIIGQLSRIRELKVISRTSVVLYKKTRKTVKEIARELGVANILEGSIQKEGETIRVNAQLIDAESGFHVWSAKYDRKLASVFAIQDEISQAIADALKVKLRRDSLDELNAERPGDMALYEIYLQAMYFLNSKYILTYQEEDFFKAVKMFEEAISIDPEDATFYNGLAWAYWHRYAITDSDEDLKQFIASADKGYQLDPENPGSNLGKGFIQFLNAEYEKAFEKFQIAFEKMPNSFRVCSVIGFAYYNLGLYRSAIPFWLKSAELAPYYLFSKLFLAYCHEGLGEFEKAEGYLREAINLNPRNPFSLAALGIYLIKVGRYDEAWNFITKLENVAPGFSFLPAYKAFLFAAKGEKEKALNLSQSSRIYSFLGMKDKAIDIMQRAISKGEPFHYFELINDPRYNNLHEDPRFKKIVAHAKKIHEELFRKYGNLF